MSAVADFRDPVRAFLGDFNATVRKYQDTAIDSVVKTVVQCGELPGYALDQSKQNITPSITLPRDYALLVYRVCLAFVRPRVAAYSYRTRSMAETFGNQRDFLAELNMALYQLENGNEVFATWTSFASWAQSITGLDVWAHMTSLTVDAPVAEATVGRDGVQINNS